MTYKAGRCESVNGLTLETSCKILCHGTAGGLHFGTVMLKQLDIALYEITFFLTHLK